jgi:branched-chain amino acid transport system ATP-binding protein
MKLEITDLTFHYGSACALRGVSLAPAAPYVAIIGPNGAGKSTLLRCLARMERYAGSIRYGDLVLDRMSPVEVARRGIVTCPEGRLIFPELSVLDNLRLGAFGRKERARVARDLDAVFELFPRLLERKGSMGGVLSGGEQQMLAIGRALMRDPRLLVLDEPSFGLSPIVKKAICEALLKIRAQRELELLIVEQDTRMAFAVADHVYVMRNGSIVAEGRPQDMLADPELEKKYLGAYEPLHEEELE